MIRTVDSGGSSGERSAQPLRTGRVLDANGQPVAGAGIEVVWGTVSTPDVARITDGSGRFLLSLPEGRFQVRAITADGRRAEIEVSGGSGPPIEIRFAQDPGGEGPKK